MSEFTLPLKIDRFYRHLSGLLSTLEQLNSLGVSLASVQEKLDFTTPWGKLMLTVLGMLAEIYIDNLRQETKKGHRQRARRGMWNGEIPYGYCTGLCANCTDPNGPGYCPNHGKSNITDGKRLIAHPIESIGVRLAFEWYATGDISMADIARKLSGYPVTLPDGTQAFLRQKGHENHNAKGAFSKDMIRNLLHRVAYIGKLPYVGFDDAGKYRSRKLPQEVFEGLQPAIISEELFENVKKTRKALTSGPKIAKERIRREFLLTGILKCGQCGSNIRGVSNRGKYFYYIDGRRVDAVNNCHQKLIRAHDIEGQVVGFLKAAIAQLDERKTIQRMQERSSAVEERFKRARELYLAGHINREEYDKELQIYEEQENDLRTERVGATIASVELMRSEMERWDELSTIEKKRLLRLALGGAWVKGNALVAVQPSAAFLSLLDVEKVCKGGEGGPLINRS